MADNNSISTEKEVEVATAAARDFLKSNGFEDLVPILVEKHKFQDVNDLKLLIDNSEVMKNLDLPFCTALKLSDKLMTLDKGKDDKDKRTKKGTRIEIPKKELLVRSKDDMSAQAANYAWNKFNNIINNRVRSFHSEGKWQGSGALKLSTSTSEEQCRANLQLCTDIMEDDSLKDLYGVYNVQEDAKVTLDKAKVKKLISGIMCSLRKPSAYKAQAPKEKKRPLKTAKDSSEALEAKSKRPKRTSSKLSQRRHPTKTVGSSFDENSKETISEIVEKVLSIDAQQKEPPLDDSGLDLDIEGIVSSQEQSNYEKERMQKVKENDLLLLKSGLVSREQAIIISLHYFKQKTISAVTMTKLKRECKENCIPFAKNSSKEDMLRSLGQALFEKKIVQRKDDSEVINYENLVTMK